MILINVKFTVRPEYAEEWLPRVEGFTRATRAEPGNVFFEWSQSVEDPNQFVLLEAFKDSEAGEKHVNSEHFRAAMSYPWPGARRLARTPPATAGRCPRRRCRNALVAPSPSSRLRSSRGGPTRGPSGALRSHAPDAVR